MSYCFIPTSDTAFSKIKHKALSAAIVVPFVLVTANCCPPIFQPLKCFEFKETPDSGLYCRQSCQILEFNKGFSVGVTVRLQ